MNKTEVLYRGEPGNEDVGYECLEIRVLEEGEFCERNNIKSRPVLTNLTELNYLKQRHSFDELKDCLLKAILQIEEVEKLYAGAS